jgi:hypothetical protein
MEKLEVYNLGTKQVDPIAQDWFHFKSRSISVTSLEAQGQILYLYPLLFCLINFYFAISIYWWFTNRELRYSERLYKPFLMLATVFWIANLGFSIIATINVFRYQFAPMIFCFSFTVLLTELLNTKRSSLNPAYAK